MRKRKSGAFRIASLLLLLGTVLLAVLAPDFSLSLVHRFWRTTTTLIGIFSIEAAMGYLRVVVGATPGDALLAGLIWVNVSWVWWVFFFSGARTFGAFVRHSSSRRYIVRYCRVGLKRMIHFASEKAQSRNRFVRAMRHLIAACRGSRLRLAALFFFAGILPHADIASIFVAVTFGLPMLFVLHWRKIPLFPLPRLVLWTAVAMNLKILLWNQLLSYLLQR